MANAVIDPEKIRRELDEVWTTLGREAGEAGEEVMRACALTLITVVDEDQNPDAVLQSLAELMREHPSRSIVVRVAAGEDDRLEAGVDARCWRPFGGRQQICSEQIVMQCSQKTLAEAPGVILPLVVADLPAVLWCPSARACRSPAFPALAATAGRIILDTGRCPEAGAVPGAAAAADLSWTRLTRWRALLAQVFENDLCRRRIGDFSRLTVYYEFPRGAGIPRAALLLAGWVGSRLGWDADRARGGLRFEGSEGSGPGRLRGFELDAEGEAGPAIRISIARHGPASGQVRVDVAGHEPLMNRVSLQPSTDVLLLGEELGIQGRDAVFEQSREWAGEWAERASDERPVA